MSKPFTIYCLSEAVSPLTHMMGVAGNEALVMRMPVYHGGRVTEVPALTGNMLRSVLIRRPGMEWLIEAGGLAGVITRPEAYFLLAGGAEYEGGGRESMKLIHDLSEACPLAGALGGCTPGQIYAGSLCVDQGVLLCRENESRVGTFLPPGCNLPDGVRLRPAAEWVARYQYYRHDHAAGVDGHHGPGPDAAERAAELADWDGKGKPESAASTPLKGERKDGKAASMPFGGECVIPGAVFAHRITLLHPTRLEIGAVLFSLRLWSAYASRVGGMTARGHGLLRTVVSYDPAAVGSDDEYAAHVLARADALGKWLIEAFRPKRGADAKPKKGRGKKADDKPAEEAGAEAVPGE